MSSYNELVKNFERIRSFMREFYIYGFKSREEYQHKSARSYDDERRRIESWLGEHIRFVRTHEGKKVFISIDSRAYSHNPFYKAFKAKSFTDGDITLHFILFDILYSSDISLSIKEIIRKIDNEYLINFDSPMVFDETTIRKKLKEYINLGIITEKNDRKRKYYCRSADIVLPEINDILQFYSEVAPLGVIGSFIIDKQEKYDSPFSFKHHYITSALDSDVLLVLFNAIRNKRMVTLKNMSRNSLSFVEHRVIPLRIFISVQNGRQHLLAYHPDFNCIKSFRTDYLSDVRIAEESLRFDELRTELDRIQKNMWGVMIKTDRYGKLSTEHVDFTVNVEPGEEFIIKRLEREKRNGSVEKLDNYTYRFSADVYDSEEMVPWIRTFICRITDINFSNKRVKNVFLQDLEEMYEMYNLTEETDDFQ